MSGGTVIEVELLSGRYHAHVWGEAQFGMAGPEWPPSPWRLLRALASAWFCARPQPSSEVDRDRLVESLARSGVPQIWLPSASLHEVRYYQPIRLGASDRVLHHDQFAVPEGGRFWFRFETDLPPEQRALLADLLARLRYLGRSESRARLRLVDREEPPPGVGRVTHSDDAHQMAPTAVRRVLWTTPDFRAADLWSIRTEEDQHGHPTHLVDALLGQRMPLPCGTAWIEYPVPPAALVYEIRPRRASAAPVAPDVGTPDVDAVEVRFRLSRRVPIPLRSIVAVARAFRNAAVEGHRARSGRASSVLSGRASDGTVARGHQHVYYLPRLRLGAGTIEEFVVRVPGARLSRWELDALLGVEHIRAGGPGYPITVVPETVVTVARPARPARRWCSATPFLPPLRHRRGRDETCPEQQVAACVEAVCGRRPTRVERLPGPGGLGCISSLLAHSYGTTGRRWTFTRRLGVWLALTFDDPVVIDRPVGADAHFGAGQFEPE